MSDSEFYDARVIASVVGAVLCALVVVLVVLYCWMYNKACFGWCARRRRRRRRALKGKEEEHVPLAELQPVQGDVELASAAPFADEPLALYCVEERFRTAPPGYEKSLRDCFDALHLKDLRNFTRRELLDNVDSQRGSRMEVNAWLEQPAYQDGPLLEDFLKKD